jgi:hypothetical protein
VIPGGITSQLQDTLSKKSFKPFMYEAWTKWIQTSHDILTWTGRTSHPVISEVCVWGRKLWEFVKGEMSVKSFEKDGVSNVFVWTEDKASFEESDHQP